MRATAQYLWVVGALGLHAGCAARTFLETKHIDQASALNVHANCESSRCREGQSCRRWEGTNGVRMTCEILCLSDEDCPSPMKCEGGRFTDGPGSVCFDTKNPPAVW